MSQFEKVELFKGQSLCISLISCDAWLSNASEGLLYNSG